MKRKQEQQYKVRIPSNTVTYFQKSVFERVLLQTHQRHAALVYCVMYDRAWHKESKSFTATQRQIVEWTGLDSKTVSSCIRALLQSEFITRRGGTLRSRSDKPIWEVPAARFNMLVKGWVAVPRFLVTEYLPVYPNAVLLLHLLYFHSKLNLNWTWVSPWKLYLQSHCWSQKRIYAALAVMSNKGKWRELKTGLPQPLLRNTMKTITDQIWRRHYRVRCIVFAHHEKQKKRLVYLHPAFAKHFGISAPKPSGSDLNRAEQTDI